MGVLDDYNRLYINLRPIQRIEWPLVEIGLNIALVAGLNTALFIFPILVRGICFPKIWSGHERYMKTAIVLITFK